MTKLDKALLLFWKNNKKADDARIATLTPPDGVYESVSHQYLPDGHIHHTLDVYYPENYTDDMPAIIDIHGGGWMYGDKELNKNYCLTLAKKGYLVFNMSYRLYPETNICGQLQDIAFAFRWIKENLSDFPWDKKNIFLTGDSAGGMLAFYSAMISGSEYLRECFDTTDHGLSFNAVALTCPMLFMDDGTFMRYYTRVPLGKNYKNEKWADLINMDNLLPYGKVPPLFMLTCSGDAPAGRQTRQGSELLRKAGVPHQLMDFAPYKGKDLPHVFPILWPDAEASDRATEEMLRFFKKHSAEKQSVK